MLNENSLSHLPSHKKIRKNITQAESTAKINLSNNNDKVMKKANNGSAVVIQNHNDYIAEGLKQLSDKQWYRFQEENLTSAHNQQIKSAVNDILISKEISQKTADCLFIENPRTAKFYLLPKIHKNILPPPSRPIVSANTAP